MQKEKKTMVKKINKEELETIALAYLNYLERKNNISVDNEYKALMVEMFRKGYREGVYNSLADDMVKNYGSKMS